MLVNPDMKLPVRKWLNSPGMMSDYNGQTNSYEVPVPCVCKAKIPYKGMKSHKNNIIGV